MEEKDTSDLREELMAEPNLEAYLKDNEDAFIGGSIAEDLNAILVDRAISKLDLARRASMSEIYVRQIFSGRRFPSRDRLLCLCAALELTMATMSRRHNDANVLAMGQKYVTFELAKLMTDAFITTEFDGGRHRARVNKIE